LALRPVEPPPARGRHPVAAGRAGPGCWAWNRAPPEVKTIRPQSWRSWPSRGPSPAGTLVMGAGPRTPRPPARNAAGNSFTWTGHAPGSYYGTGCAADPTWPGLNFPPPRRRWRPWGHPINWAPRCSWRGRAVPVLAGRRVRPLAPLTCLQVAGQAVVWTVCFDPGRLFPVSLFRDLHHATRRV